jgi:glyoxylase-like metal-dependent hydrolase (beta-lactamase superfamily II)
LHGSLFQALPVWQSFHHPIADWRHNKSSCMTITTIDCHYLDRPEFAAAYLLVDGDEAAFIDNNTHHALPRLLAALAGTGLAAEQVRYLIITHVHLDHAGGTSALAQACPQATVLAHPRAARHVIDPDKLIASAKSVYGEDEFRRLYGEIEPVDKDRVQSIEDGEKVTLGQRELEFLHTRGHANHHFCIADAASGSVFTGDAFGLIYPALQRQGCFAFPSTSPTDFDGELARASIRRITGLSPERVYPTHYGEVVAVDAAAAQLIRHLEYAERLMLEAEVSDTADEALQSYIEPRLRSYFNGLLDGHGSLSSEPATWNLLALDIELNAQGLAFVAAKRRRKAREDGA